MPMNPLDFEPVQTKDNDMVDCGGNDGCGARINSDLWEKHLYWHRNLWRTAAQQVEVVEPREMWPE